MKAIQTKYNGVTYRSRTEARWAAFFDHYRLDARYESEGFDMAGVRYLPDFQHPNAFIEIKGTSPTAVEIDKASRLAAASGKPVLILIGTPTATQEFTHLLIRPDEPAQPAGLGRIKASVFVVTNEHWTPLWFGPDEHESFGGTPYPGDGIEAGVAFASNLRFGVHEQ